MLPACVLLTQSPLKQRPCVRNVSYDCDNAAVWVTNGCFATFRCGLTNATISCGAAHDTFGSHLCSCANRSSLRARQNDVGHGVGLLGGAGTGKQVRHEASAAQGSCAFRRSHEQRCTRVAMYIEHPFLQCMQPPPASLALADAFTSRSIGQLPGFGNSGNLVWGCGALRLLDLSRVELVALAVSNLTGLVVRGSEAKHRSWSRAQPRVDKLVLPMANILTGRDHDAGMMHALISLIEQINRTTVITGIGAQQSFSRTQHYLDLHPNGRLPGGVVTQPTAWSSEHTEGGLTPLQRRLLDTVERTATSSSSTASASTTSASSTAASHAFGVRGAFTASLLRLHNLSHVVETGCPSFMLNAESLGLGASLQSKSRAVAEILRADSQAGREHAPGGLRVVFVLPNLHSHNPRRLMRLLLLLAAHFGISHSTFVLQDKRDAVPAWNEANAVSSQLAAEVAGPATSERTSELGSESDHTVFHNHSAFMGMVPKRMRMFWNLTSWQREYKRANFVLSARIHGAVMGIVSEVPTFLIATWGLAGAPTLD